MNFRPELAAKVMAGDKTVTRRLTSENPNSPWWEVSCSLEPGRDYAVCPGRGKNAIGRVRVTGLRQITLGRLSDEEAQREGFTHRQAFEEAWTAINGSYDPGALVWRVKFKVVAADA